MKDPRINQYIALGPASYRFLRSFCLERALESNGASRYEVRIELAKQPSHNSEYLILRFEGACDLRIGKLEGLRGLLVEVWNVVQDGLEGIRYHVVESEEEAFSFDCLDFSFEVNRAEP